MYCAKTENWYLERVIWLVAGLFSLVGTTLGLMVNPWWFALPALVGINLTIFALTGFCIMANLLVLVGLKSRIQ